MPGLNIPAMLQKIRKGKKAMSNVYAEWREKQQKKMDDLFKGRVFFAFNDEQFMKGMSEIGAASTSELFSMGAGGYYKKTDADKIRAFFNDSWAEQEDKMKRSLKFDFDMFEYELANHEFCITYELDETLDGCGLTTEEIGKSRNIYLGLAMALLEYSSNATPAYFGISYTAQDKKAVMATEKIERSKAEEAEKGGGKYVFQY